MTIQRKVAQPYVNQIAKPRCNLTKDRLRHCIPLRAERWDVKVRSAEKLAATLRARMGDALLFRFLAQLRPDVPLEEDLEDLEWKGAHREPFTALCDELGFDRLRDRPHKWAD